MTTSDSSPSEIAEAWREARKKYQGIEDEVERIVAACRAEFERWKQVSHRIEYNWFRQRDTDVEMERVAAIVWLADELAKRPALTVQLDPRANACAAPSSIVITGSRIPPEEQQ